MSVRKSTASTATSQSSQTQNNGGRSDAQISKAQVDIAKQVAGPERSKDEQ